MTRVPEGSVGLLERLGRYSRTLPAGRHWRTPVVDRVLVVDLSDRELVLEDEPLVTQDDLVRHVEVRVGVAVVDPVLATYAVHDLGVALELLARTTLRTHAGTVPHDRLEATAAHVLRVVLTEAVPAWGVRLLGASVAVVPGSTGPEPGGRSFGPVTRTWS